MPDPETTTLITVFSTYGLPLFTETVKFLYGQATEVLKARRERKKATEGGSSHELKGTATTPPLPDIFDGEIAPLVADLDALEPIADTLNDLRKGISDYAEGIANIDAEDRELLGKLDAVRRLLELVYCQRITFKGEQREASRTLVRGSIDVNEVLGYAAGVRARLVTGGTVTGHATAERVSEGGHLVGTEVDTIKPGR
jgi:hypothetical protein